ncbi:YHS domain-containing (seleno)protein, partial [Spirulina sp. 06S082]|uniref:YHS domain-containing (seleno)protein n=1 Tax=Spirulina sp. 06S082 TaxID=3110248 RepID=UPI002B1EDDE0
MFLKRLLILALSASLFAFVGCASESDSSSDSSVPAKAESQSDRQQDFALNLDEQGRALKGYDPVAYFSKGEPVQGKDEFSFDWDDATWYFASAENRDKFAANPDKFAP